MPSLVKWIWLGAALLLPLGLALLALPLFEPHMLHFGTQGVTKYSLLAMPLAGLGMTALTLLGPVASGRLGWRESLHQVNAAALLLGTLMLMLTLWDLKQAAEANLSAASIQLRLFGGANGWSDGAIVQYCLTTAGVLAAVVKPRQHIKTLPAIIMAFAALVAPGGWSAAVACLLVWPVTLGIRRIVRVVSRRKL